MSIFVGNSWTKVADVQSIYRKIPIYDTSDEENKNLGDVVLESDFNNTLNSIETDIQTIITLLKNYDVATAIDELKILAEKVY